MKKVREPSLGPISIAYMLSLALFMGASFFPEARLWGLNSWAYFPLTVRVALLFIGMTAWAAVVSFRGLISNDTDKLSPAARTMVAVAFVALFASLFYLLRAGTYFLGDGYTLINNLASAHPVVKPRELGEELIHGWVKSLIPGSGLSVALMTYQVISIVAGVLFLAASIFAIHRLFERTIDRVLAVLCLGSAGYMLLFFGYVENYSLFCLSIGLYVLIGLLIVRHKARRWLILPCLGLVIFMHLLGVTLIPSTIYILLRNTSLGARVKRLSFAARAIAIVVIVAAVASVFLYLYNRDYFVRFAFLTVEPGQFTVEGYTLFSIKHLMDMANLLIILCPGILVLAAGLVVGRKKGNASVRPELIFLTLLVLSMLAATFVLDPKLGLARDWDLFSFSGVPLSMLLVVLLLPFGQRLTVNRVAVSLCIILAVLSLFPRAIIQRLPALGPKEAERLMALDPDKSRTSFSTLALYYQGKGDTARFAQIQRFRGLNFPQEQMVRQASTLLPVGKTQEAKYLLQSAIRRDPQYSEAWIGLSRAYLDLRSCDSALTAIRIADGLNPYSAVIQYDMGRAYACQGKFDRAERAWLRSIHIDSNQALPLWNLATLYGERGDAARQAQFLTSAAGKVDAPPALLKEATEHYLLSDDITSASHLLTRYLKKTSDSAYVRKMEEQYPELRDIL
ncbi:MAG TPA: tetratricopeptide repeat protein [Candidatus Acidoferrum sp.]|nr:tetratricopeptide repeat protein [Candidatus Acidoferrum sp.]